VLGSGGEWRGLMEAARQAARKLAGQGSIVITQKGQVLAIDAASLHHHMNNMNCMWLPLWDTHSLLYLLSMCLVI
jgi:hypothetical protein